MNKRLFQTRLNRKTFFIGIIFYFIFYRFIVTLYQQAPRNLYSLFSIASLVSMIIVYSLIIRRINDIGLPTFLAPLYIFSLLLPYIYTSKTIVTITNLLNVIFLLVLIFKSGQNNTNKFGAKPKNNFNFFGLFGNR